MIISDESEVYTRRCGNYGIGLTMLRKASCERVAIWFAHLESHAIRNGSAKSALNISLVKIADLSGASRYTPTETSAKSMTTMISREEKFCNSRPIENGHSGARDKGIFSRARSSTGSDSRIRRDHECDPTRVRQIRLILTEYRSRRAISRKGSRTGWRPRDISIGRHDARARDRGISRSQQSL